MSLIRKKGGENMRQDILTQIISRLRLSGMHEVEAQLILIELIYEMNNQGVITIIEEGKLFPGEVY